MKRVCTLKEFLSENQNTSGWKIENEVLAKNFSFPGFEKTIQFVNKVADVAEEMNHHPRMIIDYDKVRIETFTHDEGKITDKDFVLAKEIDSI